MLANRVSGRGVVKILNRCPNTNASSSVGLEIKVKEFFSRALVSMGAVGAIAPTVFQSLGVAPIVFW